MNDSVRSNDPPLDTLVRVFTPERIVFDYPLAGPFPRFCAYLLDLIFLTLVVISIFITAMTMSGGGSGGVGLALVGFFAVSWGYGVFCEGLLNGRTLGKRLLGLRVISEQGVPITAAQAVIRNLVGAADGPIPFFYLLALVTMTFNRKFQRLGDLAAGTLVIVEQRRPRLGLLQFRDEQTVALLDLLPARLAVDSRSARALSDYVRRRQRFGQSLRQELAEPLAARLREQFDLPTKANADSVLCAVYQRVFLGG